MIIHILYTSDSHEICTYALMEKDEISKLPEEMKDSIISEFAKRIFITIEKDDNLGSEAPNDSFANIQDKGISSLHCAKALKKFLEGKNWKELETHGVIFKGK